MNKQTTFYYLLKFQYLGFRYHGWQVQPAVKTVQKMVEKTLSFVLEHSDFKILGASRTDAMVLAEESAFELFVKKPLDTVDLMARLNKSLPNDIRILSVSAVDAALWAQSLDVWAFKRCRGLSTWIRHEQQLQEAS